MFLELWPEIWVFSSCDENMSEPLMLSVGSQESLSVVRGLSGSLLTWFRGLGAHLELRWETQCSSPALTEISGFL